MSNSTTAGEIIALPEATDLVTNFRTQFPNEIKATTFDVQLIQEILSQPDCAKLKFYYGYDSGKGNLAPVLVGVDSNGSDMTSGIIVDRGEMCPPVCDVNSVLMK